MFAPMMQYRDGRPNDPISRRVVGETPKLPMPILGQLRNRRGNYNPSNPFSGLTPDDIQRRIEYERNNPDEFRQGIMPVPMRAVGETPKNPNVRLLTDMRARLPIGSFTPARSLGGGPSPDDLANIRAENAAYQAKIASGELVRDPGQRDQGPPRYVTRDEAIKIQEKVDQARQADLSMTPEERNIGSRSLINAQESAARDFMPVKPFSPVDQPGGRPMPQPVLTPQPIQFNEPFAESLIGSATQQPRQLGVSGDNNSAEASRQGQFGQQPQFGQVQQQPQFNQQGMQQMMQFMQQMMQMFSMMSGQGGQGGFGGGFNQRPPMFGGGYGGGMGGGFGQGGYQQFQQPQQRPMPRYPRMQNNYSQSPFGRY